MIRMAMSHINVIRQKLCFFTTGRTKKQLFLVIYFKKGIKVLSKVSVLFMAGTEEFCALLTKE
jgi:hypothetical protein